MKTSQLSLTSRVLKSHIQKHLNHKEKPCKHHCTVSPYLLFLFLPLHFYFCPDLHTIFSCFYPHYVNMSSSNNLITEQICYSVALVLAFSVESGELCGTEERISMTVSLVWFGKTATSNASRSFFKDDTETNLNAAASYHWCWPRFMLCLSLLSLRSAGM